MKISTKGRYALKVMVDIAENSQPVSIRNVAKRQGLSEKYLEQIISMLVRAKLLVSFRGAQGGYKLARLPEEITVGEILNVAEGEVYLVECLRPDSKCNKAEDCKTIQCFSKLNNLINDFLNNVSLKDLI